MRQQNKLSLDARNRPRPPSLGSEGDADTSYIQQLLGHEKLEMTAIYTEVNIRQLQEVHRRCHPSGQLPALAESG